MNPWLRRSWRICGSVMAVLSLTSCMGQVGGTAGASGQAEQSQLLRGRALVTAQACGFCHGGGADPAAAGWLAGMRTPAEEFKIGPCATTPGATPCFITRPRNLTPDDVTGMGRYTERQIFNALRYGLRPSETPDVEITSTTPGQGNFPATPKYLAPPMPWEAWRHLPDQDLRAIAAYLKNGLNPVNNLVKNSDAPADSWASDYTVEKIGPYPAASFPTANEIAGQGPQDRVRRGRFIAITKDCGGCHGGGSNPLAKGYLAGMTSPQQEFVIGPFKTRPRNLTPDNTTGLGRFTERQIFNALRYGLRPGETPDVEITSTTPGQGNHPANPKYMAPPMPWPSWRHAPDADLWAVAAYLKYGLRPVNNLVKDSEGPPDFWASEYTVAKIGPYPTAPFPTANEMTR